MNISKKDYYNFTKRERIKTIVIYDQFINWVIGEFCLYQIEEYEGLKVYFPNGCFRIDISHKCKKYIEIIIKIKSRTLNDGKNIENKVNTIFSNIKRVRKINSKI